MYAILSANNNAEVYIIPYIPPELEITEEQAIDEYDGLSFCLTMPGNMKPRAVSWSALYPRNVHAFSTPGCGTDPEGFAAFLRKWREKHWPIRLVIMDDGNTILNMPVLVDSFSYSYTKSNDMDYSISLKEYQFI